MPLLYTAHFFIKCVKNPLLPLPGTVFLWREACRSKILQQLFPAGNRGYTCGNNLAAIAIQQLRVPSIIDNSQRELVARVVDTGGRNGGPFPADQRTWRATQQQQWFPLQPDNDINITNNLLSAKRGANFLVGEEFTAAEPPLLHQQTIKRENIFK